MTGLIPSPLPIPPATKQVSRRCRATECAWMLYWLSAVALLADRLHHHDVAVRPANHPRLYRFAVGNESAPPVVGLTSSTIFVLLGSSKVT